MLAVAGVTGLKVGLVAESPVDLYTLKNVIADAGLTVAVSIEFARWDGLSLSTDVDGWVVNLDVEKLEVECPEKIDNLLDHITTPLILCEGGAPPTPADHSYNGWKRRLIEKIDDLAGAINLEKGEYEIPKRVWVLAGSIGGPQAIREFMGSLPENLDIAFVYANHLESDFQSTLARAISKDSAYPAYVAAHGDVLRKNHVAVISPDYVTNLKPNGTITVSQGSWTGQYQPNLNHVIANVASTFGRTGGVIIFSGMCDDGAASCRLMKQSGGRVWVQKPDTCVSSAMPDATIATGSVDLIGTPKELALSLVNWSAKSKTGAQP